MDDDYDVALMWQTEQDLQCPGCLQPRDEVWVFSPDEQHEKEAAVEAKRRMCVACRASEWDRHSWHEESKDAPPIIGMGIHHTIGRKEVT